ncbi:hypothetical protein G6F24_017938 [Rhizopus arrhizus]|nr:hypothetical protein G6F24_017938 [Rhizopus arrhizus]
MMSQLKNIIPGAEHWPQFRRNASEQFEARTALLEVVESPSILLRGMAGSRLQVAVAHGEGQAVFDNAVDQAAALPAEPERLAGRHHRPDQQRWPRHHHDAAPGAHPARAQPELGAGRMAG